MKRIGTLLVLIWIFYPLVSFADEGIPRHIVTFWDSEKDVVELNSLVHKILEMPLNYLGYDLIYYDIRKPLPDISNRRDIVGILLCFGPETHSENPYGFIQWLKKGIDEGYKVIVMRNPGFFANTKGMFTATEVLNSLWEKMGFIMTHRYVDYPFENKITYEDSALIPYERKYAYPLPPFPVNQVDSTRAKSYLKVGLEGDEETFSDLIIIGPNGGYVAPKFGTNYDEALYDVKPRTLGWHINPFKFFELIFERPAQPILDTTTLAGRRIFYSYVDGDAWNLPTEIQKYRKKDWTVADVVLEELIKPFPEIPIAVGPVAADADLKWVGTERSQESVREYFHMPQVEAATHTYSHPFDWHFFATGDPDREVDYLHLYSHGTWKNSFLSWTRAKYYESFQPDEFKKFELKWGYITPRAYAMEPFNIEKEVMGSVNFLNQFAPLHNQVELMLWSGDAGPWGKAVQLCYEGGIKNIGGGFVRFDDAYPSILFVHGLGRKPDGWFQVYLSDSGEIAYTDGWKKDFFAFKYLPQTLKNTEEPLRLKPIALYYHSYSGQFRESVDAILSNIKYIKTQKTIPIRVKRFCDIATGFVSAKIIRMSEGKWRVKNRAGLQTLRFDDVENLAIDLLNSVGVVGYNKYKRCLYVYLDSAVEEPIISVQLSEVGTLSYLEESSWEVWNLQREGKSWEFETKGWGSLEMVWRVPSKGVYTLTVTQEDQEPVVKTVESKEGNLEFTLDLPFDQEVGIKIQPGDVRTS